MSERGSDLAFPVLACHKVLNEKGLSTQISHNGTKAQKTCNNEREWILSWRGGKPAARKKSETTVRVEALYH